MGRKIVLTGTKFTDTTRPVLPQYDSLESAGSILLLDPNHPLGAFDGVPTDNQRLPNIVAPLAANIFTDATNNHQVLANVVGSYQPTVFEVERTGKGGLHAMLSQTNQTTSQQALSIEPTAATRQYIIDNFETNDFYFSVWSQVTRQGNSGGNVAPQSLFHFSSSTTDYGFFTTTSSVNNGAGAENWEPSINRFGANSVDVPHFISFQDDGWVSGTLTGNERLALLLGTGDAWGSFNINKTPSTILYRLYIEDLTVSGRTYQEVQALDKQLFDAAFSEGGRLANDTYSDPNAVTP